MILLLQFLMPFILLFALLHLVGSSSIANEMVEMDILTLLRILGGQNICCFIIKNAISCKVFLFICLFHSQFFYQVEKVTFYSQVANSFFLLLWMGNNYVTWFFDIYHDDYDFYFIFCYFNLVNYADKFSNLSQSPFPKVNSNCLWWIDYLHTVGFNLLVLLGISSITSWEIL